MSAEAPEVGGEQLLEAFISISGIQGMPKEQKIALRLCSKKIKLAVDAKISQAKVYGDVGFEKLPNLTWPLTSLECVNLTKNRSPQEMSGILDAVFRKFPLLENLKITIPKRLESLPESISGLSSLTSLEIFAKALTLPSSFTKLTGLEELSIQCMLKQLPTGIAPVQHLKGLKFFSLHIYEFQDEEKPELNFPDYIYQMPLQDLQLRVNVKRLPKDIGRLRQLAQLTVKTPALQQLPESFINLSALRVLAFYNCLRLERLPENFKKFPLLEQLSLEKCPCLTALPKDIGNLKNLRVLNLSECSQLSTLPSSFSKLELETLRIKKLPWTRLPGAIAQLRHLKNLCVCEFNRLEIPDSFIQLENSLTSVKFWGCGRIQTSDDEVLEMFAMINDAHGGMLEDEEGQPQFSSIEEELFVIGGNLV